MDFIKDILKGVIIGVANAIPGVSGGTMMVSMGIYDDIIFCITHLFKQLKKSVMTLLPYFIGMVVGIVGLAFVIEWLYANYPFQTSMVFIGLIFGGIPMLWKELKSDMIRIPHIVIFLLFFAAVVAMQCFGGDGGEVALTVGVVSLVKIFFVGVIASATMVIPGVSGSMMLQIMGYYKPIMSEITGFVSALKDGNWDTLLHIGAILMPFGIGVVLGIFVIAKLIEFLLKKWKGLTYSAILGLVISSPVVILMGTPLAGIGVITVITGVATLLIGILVAAQLGK